MRSIHVGSVVAVVLAVCCLSRRADALGEESFGNASVHGQNYREWPDIVPLLNHDARVYRSWVNGNERFLFKGDAEALNAFLAEFAKVEGKRVEVVLRPGPAVGKSFHGKEVPYDWALHFMGGIAEHVTTLGMSDQVWSNRPELTIYVGGDDGIDLTKIEFPAGVTLGDAPAVAKRVAAGMTGSTDKTVRGWGCGQLAELDPYSAENAKAIAGMLNDPDNWVRQNAAGSLGRLGKTAEPHLPALRKLVDSDDENLATAARDAVAAIEAAPDASDAAKGHAETQKQIAAFLASRKAK